MEDFLRRMEKQIEEDRKTLGPIGMKNPYRAAGPLDPVEGMTRTAARKILGNKKIKYQKKQIQ